MKPSAPSPLRSRTATEDGKTESPSPTQLQKSVFGGALNSRAIVNVRAKLARARRIAHWPIALVIWFGVVCAPCVAAGPQDWYYTDGPLRGSLKIDRPLPLYDADVDHLWNRLFAVFYIRPSELPSRPNEYPADPTQLDEYEHKMRRGEVAPGPVIKRIEGGDTMSFLAWSKTRYFFEAASFERERKLLDEFIEKHGEQLIDDPLKRAIFQRDLWTVFDHLVGQNIARFGLPNFASRRSPPADYEIRAGELPFDGEAAMQRREILCRKLAVVIKRLALPQSVIKTLPGNYAAAVRSSYFSAGARFDFRRNYLPPDLFSRPEEWVEIDTSPEPLHTDKHEGQIDYVAWSNRGRSYYRIFFRFPAGRQAVEDYLKYLQQEGVDWQKTARQGYITLKPGVRQIPVGTQTAIVEFMIALDDQLEAVPTEVAESVRVSIYKNVDGTPDPETNTGRGMSFRAYVLRRRLLFDKLNQGGLERLADDAFTYTVLLNGHQDWGISARQQSAIQSCLGCHMYEKDRVGVFSLNTIFCFAPDTAMPGIVIPMGSGEIRPYPRGQRVARWKLGQEDYLRLVEYARSASVSR